jgi:hypothetical protein
MTNEEVKKAILEHLIEIDKIVREYCPEDPYLTMTLNVRGSEYGYISFNNSYWEHSDSKAINATFRKEWRED